MVCIGENIMAETVVHVITLSQWHNVLDVWFKRGYAWSAGDKEYSEHIFENGGRYLFLDDYITYSFSNSDSKPFIKYADFMSQQKEDNKMETYYVTQEQLNCIEDFKDSPWPMNRLLVNSDEHIVNLFYTFNESKDKAFLRYLGGDTSIEFKVKEQLYRLLRIDDDGDTVYMHFHHGTPSWTTINKNAFTAPLKEIIRWQTPAWRLEEVD